MPCQFILDIWPKARSKCYSVCYTELIVDDLPHIATIWTLCQRAHSTISFFTVAILHTALITCILPNLSHRVPWGWDHFELPTVKFEFNKRNFIVRSLFQYVWLFIYTDLVLSGCVVILKIFHRGLLYYFSVMCILFMYCCKHVQLTCV